MADPFRYPDTADETRAAGERGSSTGSSIRTKIVVIVLVVVVLIFVGLHLAGIRPNH